LEKGHRRAHKNNSWERKGTRILGTGTKKLKEGKKNRQEMQEGFAGQKRGGHPGGGQGGGKKELGQRLGETKRKAF